MAQTKEEARKNRSVLNIGGWGDPIEGYGTSNPSPNVGNIRDTEGASLGVQDNANLAHFIEDPETFNNTPAVKKSYSWNRGEYGNGNGPT